ncbi:MAG: phosphoribosylglycinamide formyltransferase [Opitutae bacterium]|jgi:phosphoribosylglycinamide formyltransferase 1|nr:phosphoribosylglycinamide formyltransferase [Opitutae bacterium]MBT5716730.1 phosphoribosylglycinamide formyltransferase [Opitutae bacterium]
MRIVILGSGTGSNAEAILKSSAEGQLDGTEVVGVFSDVEDSNILKHSKVYNVPAIYLDPGSQNSIITQELEENWIQEIKSLNPDLIVLAGFMRILSKKILLEFNYKVINLHPSLLPSFPGLHSIEKAFNKKVKITGCTVHWVNEEIDEGEIIAQVPVRIMNSDDLELVKQKVHAAEHMLLPWVIRDLANGTISFLK